MRKTKEEAEVTRQKLLDAAQRVFSQKGYADTRLEDVAQEARVTRGAIYHHFGGKVELYDALAKERFSRANRVLEDILAQDLLPVEKLRQLMVRALELLEEDPAYRTFQDLVLFKTAYAPELEQGMQAKRKSMADFQLMLTQLVQAGIQAGEIRADVQPENVALAALGLVNGVTMMWLLEPGRFSLKERTAPIVDMFLQGIAVRT
jgi:TetR/AcrR family transcriptional regulator, acrAB operon repressor